MKPTYDNDDAIELTYNIKRAPNKTIFFYFQFDKKRIQMGDKNTEKIFVIENSPKPNKRLSRVLKNILHINKDSVEFSVKVDEVTTKPTKVTPVKTEHV